MKLKLFASVAATLISTGISQTASADFLETFDDAPVLNDLASEHPIPPATGEWYRDRKEPAGFTNETFNGDSRLKLSIDAGDHHSTSSYHNTQGRSYLLPYQGPVSIDLYIPDAWETTGRRMAGFWGVGADASGDASTFPIIEFASDDNDGDGNPNPRFQFWTASGWVDQGLPTGFTYDDWHTLTIEMTDNDFVLSVGDIQYSESIPTDTVELASVILQGYNHDAVSYDIYWDNFKVVPEPATLALLGLGGLALLRRRRA